ncbi:hypothetical protein GCM10009844_16850 [Nocardioides koreensis]|uniref:Uncharacterized protein n=1 Tax=Nocardioides koreensis TaxID=433651 RepID=A0ABN2ZLB7_9ACTN
MLPRHLPRLRQDHLGRLRPARRRRQGQRPPGVVVHRTLRGPVTVDPAGVDQHFTWVRLRRTDHPAPRDIST